MSWGLLSLRLPLPFLSELLIGSSMDANPGTATQRMACHDCDLLHSVVPIPENSAALCQRCAGFLYHHKKESLDRTLTITLAALIFFVLANVYPFMMFKLSGRVQVCTLFSTVVALYDSGWVLLAGLVFMSSILIPFIKIVGLLYVLLPLKTNRVPWRLAHSYRVFQVIQPWGMLEVYLLGCLVSFIKLSQLATVVLGTAFYSFMALILLTTWAASSLDPRIIWERTEVQK